MKGSPRSIWLTWANRAAGTWTSAMVSHMQRQQSAMLKALTKPPAKPKRKRKSKRR